MASYGCGCGIALDRALGCGDIKNWAQAWNRAQGTKLIDWSIFTPVALHYTANPILGPGVRSPMAGRWCLLRGTQDRATLVLPPEPVVPTYEAPITTVVSVAVNGSVSTRRRSFSELVGLIGSAEFGFYEPIKTALGRAAADGQDREATIRAVSAAVLQADPGHRDRATILRYADRLFLTTAFNSFSRHDAQLRRANEQTLPTMVSPGGAAMRTGSVSNTASSQVHARQRAPGRKANGRDHSVAALNGAGPGNSHQDDADSIGAAPATADDLAKAAEATGKARDQGGRLRHPQRMPGRVQAGQ